MTQITADWAWISKDPAEGIAYSVLETSAAAVDFGPVIGRYAPGSPSSTTSPDAPNAPPWVTFGPVATERDGVLMSVSVCDWWRDHDHAGRPVWPQRLFVMPFADLAPAGASYQTMWAATKDAQVPRPEPGPLPLTVSGQPTGALAATVERYGLQQLAALAAAVLDGPVVVSDAGALRRDERLAVLDAVAALLPYGFRADLSVSSAVDNTVKHGIRLTFADYPGTGQQLRSLRTPAPAAGSELSARYLVTLAEKVATRGLQAVLDHLWAFRRPCSFDHPGAALAILADLDFYGGLGRALREGRATRDQVLKFFADPGQAREYWAVFDAQMRENALLPYLADRDEDVLAAALRWWEFTRHDVSKVVNQLLGAGGAPFGIWCLKVARTVSANLPDAEYPNVVADWLLGKMLVPVGLGEQDYARHQGILVELLLQISVPEPGQLPYSCDELRFGDLNGWQAHLVRELLADEAAAAGGQRQADRGVRWATWLCQSPAGASADRPYWVGALDFALSPAPGPAAECLRTVIRQDAAWAVVLLWLAGRIGSLRPVIEAADRQLIEVAAAPSAQAGSPGAALREQLDLSLWQLRVAPPAVAAVDVVRVLLGGTPLDLAGPLTEAQLDGYGDGLGPALGLAAVLPRRAEVERAFLRHVVSGGLDAAGVWLLNTWAPDPDRIGGLADFIVSLEPGERPYDTKLTDGYWNALARRPELAGYAAVQQLVIATRESVLAGPAAFRRDLTADGVTSTPLARACFQARCAGLSPPGIVAALAKGGADRIEQDELDAVLRELGELLSLRQGPAADADVFECRAVIVWGALGPVYGEQFRLRLIERLRFEGTASRRAARILRGAGRQRAKADRAEWVSRVVAAGLGEPPEPWYQRWSRALRRRLPGGGR